MLASLLLAALALLVAKADDTRTCLLLDDEFVCPHATTVALDYSTAVETAPRVDAASRVCPCAAVPISVPSVPIDDLSTLCALVPSPLPAASCEDRVAGEQIEPRLIWRASQIPVAACPTTLHDDGGPCGDVNATWQYAPVCALVGAVDGESAMLLRPHVPPSALEEYAATQGRVKNECTRDALATLASANADGFKCAARACSFPDAITTVQSTCSDESIDACADNIELVSFACAKAAGALTRDHAGCTTSISATLCNAECDGSGAGALRTATKSACVPTTACPATPCERGACRVPGRRARREPCTFECPNVPAAFRKERDTCVGNTCGGPGTANVHYIPCVAGTAGCLEFDSPPENATIACETAPCPCSDAGCEPRDGEVYATLDAMGNPCASAVLDVSGVCCPSAKRDACGLCADSPYDGIGPVRVGLDATGACCSGSNETEPILTPALECCADVSNLDVCGICGGDGGSCEIVIDTTSVVGRTRDVARKMVRALGVAVRTEVGGHQIVAPVGSGRALGTLTRAFVNAAADVASERHRKRRRRRHTRDVPGPNLVLHPRGVRGNGVCEFDENAVDEPACTLSAQACPALAPDPISGEFLGDPASECGGNGVCLRAASMCRCVFGYTGPSCGECVQGFRPFPSASGRLECASGRANARILAIGNAAAAAIGVRSVTHGQSSGSSPAAIVTGAIASIIAAIAAALIGKYRNNIRNYVTGHPHHGGEPDPELVAAPETRPGSASGG